MLMKLNQRKLNRYSVFMGLKDAIMLILFFPNSTLDSLTSQSTFLQAIL